MTTLKVTVLLETEADPSSVLGAFEFLFEDTESDVLGLGEAVSLDAAAVDAGEAVSVEYV
jgi:hypothetical protein